MVQLQNLALVLGMALKFYCRVAKGLRLKLSKFSGLMPTFGEVTGEQLIGVGDGVFLNRVKT